MTQAYTYNFTEVHEPGGALVPTSRAAAVYTTTWLSMNNHQRAVFLVLTGAMAANSTVDFAVQQAQDAAGTGAKALTPAKAITQLTQAGGDGDDSVVVEIRTEELDVDGGFDYIRGVLTVAGGAVLTAVFPLRGCSNYPPVPTTGWTEIVL